MERTNADFEGHKKDIFISVGRRTKGESRL